MSGASGGQGDAAQGPALGASSRSAGAPHPPLDPLANGSDAAPSARGARHAFDYAVVRVVPRVEREEFLNAGVIVHCPTLEFLGARAELDLARLRALAPGLEEDHVEQIELYLRGIVEICEGLAAAGPIGRLPISQRFHWLVAPRSHVVQTGPVHAGLCSEPLVELERLMGRVVRG